MKKRILLMLLCLALAALMLFAACTKRETPSATPTPEPVATETPEPTPEPTPEATPEPTPEPTEEPVVVEALYTNPLTGEPMTEDISSLRPISVVLNNHEGALPQCGISSADIIYEMPEEGITRMLAVYSQMPDCDRLGSVRSTRPYHIDVALSYDSIFVHWGRSTAAANLEWSTGIDHIELNENPAGGYSYRDTSHGNGATEHTGFIKTSRLMEFLADHNWRTEHEAARDYGFTFADDVHPGDGDANKVIVYFASKRTNFVYDAAKNGYNMAEYGVDYVDGDTGIIPTFRNVLILRTTIYGETDIATIILTNTSGTGYLCCNGTYQNITWERGEYGDSFRYYDENGDPLVFGVGSTYVCIVSYNDTVNFE